MKSIVIMMPHVRDDVQMPLAQITGGLLVNYGCQMSDRLRLTAGCHETRFSLWGWFHNGSMLSQADLANDHPQQPVHVFLSDYVFKILSNLNYTIIKIAPNVFT